LSRKAASLMSMRFGKSWAMSLVEYDLAMAGGYPNEPTDNRFDRT
jgi:hypothetical protein